MVINRILLVGVACLCASTAFAISADDLRGASADNDRETVQKQNRANTGNMGNLLPDAPKSSKYGSPAATQNAAKKKAAKKTAATPGAGAASGVADTSNLYTPPAHSNTGDAGQSIVTDAVQQTVAFGIRLGSWLNATLDRNTTSADSGSVELTLTTDAIGDRRTLPAGTTLFADKSLNNATKRMELVITHGITPAGVEFEMRGIAFDPIKTPGLAGVYVLDKKEVATRGFAKGAIAAAGATASTLGAGAAGAAISAGSQSVLNDATQVTDSNAQQAIIYVSPQGLIIRVEKQF